MPWIARRTYKPSEYLDLSASLPDRSQSLISLYVPPDPGLEFRSQNLRDISASTGDIQSPPPAYRSPAPTQNMQAQPSIYPRLDTDYMARAQRGDVELPSYTMATRGVRGSSLQHASSVPLYPQNDGVRITTVPATNGFRIPPEHNSTSTPNLPQQNGGAPQSYYHPQFPTAGVTTGITIPIMIQAPQPQTVIQVPQPVAPRAVPVTIPAQAPVLATAPAPARPPPPAAEALAVPGAPPRYSVATSATNGNMEVGKKVNYVDFVPQLQKKHTFKPNKYEPFR